MDKPLVAITYKLADGKRISLEVSPSVKDLLEQARRQIRSQRRQDRRFLDNAEYVDGLTDTTNVIPHEDFADLIDRMDIYKRLYAAIESLPDIQQQRVYLYFFGGYTYRAIADFEGKNYKTVMRSVERAIKSLRKLITL